MSVKDKLLKGTSKTINADGQVLNRVPARLMLEDGTTFLGNCCGAEGEVFGEICFNTSLEGYLEIVTDPSYAGQIVVMSYPQIGNYGVSLEDVQTAEPALRALVVRDMCQVPSNWRSEMSLPEFLKQKGIIAIEGIDTRALISHIRDNGMMRAGISTVTLDESELLSKVQSSPYLSDTNFIAEVTCDSVHEHTLGAEYSFALQPAAKPRYRVVAYDCGVKNSILDNLCRCGCAVTVVPWDTPAEDVLAMEPNGVFLSNGPGDPDNVEATYTQVEKLLGKVPVFGICLGHQMICKASGATIEKLKFGHHGGNQPVKNMLNGRVEVTVQNHGFSVVFDTMGPLAEELPQGHFAQNCEVRTNSRYGRVALTHVNLNDNTPEGIAFLDIPAFSVQYHPEASPGPTDSHYLFTAFTRLMDGREDYLDIDIAEDRLHEWKFANEEAQHA